MFVFPLVSKARRAVLGLSTWRFRGFNAEVHYYHCFEDEWNRKSLAEQLRAVEDHRAELASFPCVVGEWSLALGGRGRAALPAAQGMAIFAAQQLRAYEAASHGWFFWNWRDGHGVAWDYRSCFEQCLLTSAALREGLRELWNIGPQRFESREVHERQP